MPRKRPICADCGEKLESSHWATDPPLCSICRRNYAQCVTCQRYVPLADMRQSYCVDCRRSYDRDRWAAQRAARGVP
jgi:hypothetical protein